MANAIGPVKAPTGNANLYAVLINKSGGADHNKIRNVVTNAWDTLAGTDLSNYDIAMAESEAGSTWYYGALPTGVAVTDEVEWVVSDHGGGTPSTTQIPIAWDMLGDTGLPEQAFSDAEIGWVQLPTGNTNLYAVVFSKSEDATYNQIRDVVAGAWEDQTTAAWGDYDVAISENGSTGWYSGTLPAGLEGLPLQWVILDNAGAAVVPTNFDIVWGRIEVEESSSSASSSSVSSSSFSSSSSASSLSLSSISTSSASSSSASSTSGSSASSASSTSSSSSSGSQSESTGRIDYPASATIAVIQSGD